MSEYDKSLLSYSIESYLDLQELIITVAEKYVPEGIDYDYDGFYVSEDRKYVEVSYSYESACDCCSYDFGTVEVPVEEFNERLLELINKRYQ